MKWTVLLLLGLGLILCMVCAGCSSSSNSAVGQLTINTSSLPAGTVGTAYSYSIPASGGIPPYVWSMSSGTLPVGLKLSSKGVISGTPESAGTVSVTVQVIDSEAVPQGATANFSIAIQTALAVTSLSPPAGTVGVSYSTTLAATGGVSPYTWTLLSGNPPAGLRLSAAGVISGTPTTSGTSTFTVQVADSESTQQTAVAQLNITVNTVTITTQSLPAGTVNVPYSAPLAAIGGVTPYTWTLSGTLPSGLSLNSSGVIAGTPTATGSATFTVHVADSEHPPATASAQLSITINSTGNPGNLQGNYAFFLNGFNSAGSWTLAGSFIADGNGNITSGVIDSNSFAGQPLNTTVTGTYAIPATGLGTLTLQGQSWGPMTFAFVLDSTGNGRMIEYDDTTGLGSRGSGALRKANSSVFSIGGLTGYWAFGLAGTGSSGERFVEIGQFSVASGNLTAGSCNINDGGVFSSCTFTGTVSSVDPLTGRAVATIESSNGGIREAIYVVSLYELVLEQIGSVLLEPDSSGSGRTLTSGAGSPLLVGSALEQTGSYSNASLNSTVVLYTQDIEAQDGLDESSAAIISFDGNGNFTVTAMDDDLSGTITQDQSSQGTYSVEGNGGVTMNCGTGNCPVGFLVNPNKGFFLGTGANSIFGIMEPQTGGPFSNASLAGSYAGGSLVPLDYANAGNEVDLGSADGVGTLTLDGDSSSSAGLDQWSGNIVNYNITANGRGTGQNQGGTPAVVYMISPTRWLVLQPKTDARVDLYQH